MKLFGAVLALAPMLVAAASNVVDLNSDNFDKEILNSGKSSMVEFFAVSFRSAVLLWDHS